MKLTDSLILLCFVFSFYAWFTPVDLAFSKSALLRGDFYTLFTAIFVHANPSHLIGNMIFLYVFGRNLEDEIGAFRMGTVFLAGGVFSFIFSIPFYQDIEMVGASAAIFSVMASSLIIRRPSLSIQFLSPLGPLVIVYFIYNIVAIQKGASGNVAYISHVIGFVIGLFFGAKWNKNWGESLIYTIILFLIYIILYNYVIALL
ncbi:MAG: rhomboid family intramembrane serine protease [Candidatus Methanoperedens sp.]|nr:rhomboid family intramembrane serine protease [Candidatus Methanoperedens sp.]MCE8424153.1 rhomboid family intramembrane serine protease [Candidatus Methanoperedens sp.]MCE8428287.1 rhomboid family intramembrane serine protease [Candidatus Methanoperedens sp.]